MSVQSDSVSEGLRLLADYTGKLLPVGLGGTALAAITWAPITTWVCWSIGAALGLVLFLIQLLDARLGWPLLKVSLDSQPQSRALVLLCVVGAGLAGGCVVGTYPSPQDFIPIVCGFAACFTVLFAAVWIWLRFVALV